MNRPLIEIEGLNKWFGQHHVLLGSRQALKASASGRCGHATPIDGG